MNSPKPYIPREKRSLKDAVTALVTACGGQERAASLTRVSPSQMQRYTAPSEHEYQMPVDVVLALEMACGKPIVTCFLGLETNHILVSTAATDDSPLSQDLAAVGAGMGRLFEEVGRAMADGNICAAEATEIEQRCTAAIAALASVMAETRRIRKGGGA